MKPLPSVIGTGLLNESSWVASTSLNQRSALCSHRSEKRLSWLSVTVPCWRELLPVKSSCASSRYCPESSSRSASVSSQSNLPKYRSSWNGFVAGPKNAAASGGNDGTPPSAPLSATTVVGREKRFASYVKKKCRRSWMIGPPTANPYSFS